MADFIYMDAAVDIDSTEVDTMATVKVADSDDTKVHHCSPPKYLSQIWISPSMGSNCT